MDALIQTAVRDTNNWILLEIDYDESQGAASAPFEVFLNRPKGQRSDFSEDLTFFVGSIASFNLEDGRATFTYDITRLMRTLVERELLQDGLTLSIEPVIPLDPESLQPMKGFKLRGSPIVSNIRLGVELRDQ